MTRSCSFPATDRGVRPGEGTADLSTTLCFGRDDKGEGDASMGEWPWTLSKNISRKGVNTEISPLRFASVEMTKVRAGNPEPRPG